ncbi:MAG: hypothetical protein WBB85_06835 [Albidovulum sp.]|uniref:hypothetical protein n=1 Tax=Albidovulum sp. TaxID=1872424 RepID=UPI003CB3432B
MAFRIFIHAFRMVFGNFGAALRISTPMIVMSLLGAFILMPDETSSTGTPAEQFSNFFTGPLLMWLLAYLVATLWVAVAWHRYCLREEYPGAIVPAFHLDRILGYFGWSILIMLVAILVSLVAGTIIGGLAAITQSAALAGLLWFGWFGVLLWFIQRLSLVLPASAINEGKSLRQSWEATRPISGTILAVALMFALFSALVGQAALPLFGVSLVLGGVINGIAQWISTMLGLSILTTIYGICIEGRTIE